FPENTTDMDYSARKQKAFPSKETTLSYWIGEADAKLAKHRTTEELPEQADVLVIGSGFALSQSVDSRKTTGRKLPHTLPCMNTKSSMWLDWSEVIIATLLEPRS
ncbi:hypothetical protein KL921_005427, partial [Ogataea angusta]